MACASPPMFWSARFGSIAPLLCQCVRSVSASRCIVSRLATDATVIVGTRRLRVEGFLRSVRAPFGDVHQAGLDELETGKQPADLLASPEDHGGCCAAVLE